MAAGSVLPAARDFAMDEDGLDAPPGFPGGNDSPRSKAPPGFPSAPTRGKAVAAAAKSALAPLQLDTDDQQQDDDVDVADPSIKLYKGLQEQPREMEFKTEVADNTIYRTAEKFENLPISKELLDGLYNEMKFERPSRIQATTLPMVLEPDDTGRYRDLVAQAQNGCGKTVCFVLSMLTRVDPGLNAPQALCMCPTRELVMQTLSVIKKMATHTGITINSTATAESGEPGGQRRRAQEIKEQVIVATHGRLHTWVSQRQLDITNVRVLVFDEGDNMLQQDSFEDESVRLIKSIRKKNKDVQIMFFSATYTMDIRSFMTKIAPNANIVWVPDNELSLDVIKQCNVRLPDWRMKADVLKTMIFPNCEKLGQTIIFVRARHSAHNLHAQLEAEGFKCTSIQGEMTHAERDRVISEFRDGVTKVLIATDVLARGFDVSQVTLVVNYDLPYNPKATFEQLCDTYLHRIGRSGRFGRKGAAFNFICSKEDTNNISKIAKHFDITIPEIQYDDESAFIDVLHKAGLTDITA